MHRPPRATDSRGVRQRGQPEAETFRRTSPPHTRPILLMTEARSRGLSSFMDGVRTVLHLSPHPDDEVLGAGATLLALRDTGHRVINLAVTLGSDERERPRRRHEVETACARAGFELVVHDPGGDLAGAVRALIAESGADVVVAPSPHDGHPRHEAVGRAARDAVEAQRGTDSPPRP